MIKHCLFFLILLPNLAFSIEKADFVLINKLTSKLYLKKNGKIIESYSVVFGLNPVGHKQQQGDKKTPEGKYILDYKNLNSAYYKSIHISYPNKSDKRHAKQLGVSPGGDIVIHGQPNRAGWFISFIRLWVNWTDGCIALSNKDMEEIWEAIDVGTPIEILANAINNT